MCLYVFVCVSVSVLFFICTFNSFWLVAIVVVVVVNVRPFIWSAILVVVIFLTLHTLLDGISCTTSGDLRRKSLATHEDMSRQKWNNKSISTWCISFINRSVCVRRLAKSFDSMSGCDMNAHTLTLTLALILTHYIPFKRRDSSFSVEKEGKFHNEKISHFCEKLSIYYDMIDKWALYIDLFQL